MNNRHFWYKKTIFDPNRSTFSLFFVPLNLKPFFWTFFLLPKYHFQPLWVKGWLYQNVKSESCSTSSWSSTWPSRPSWPSWIRWRPDQSEGEGVAGEENRGCEGHCSRLRGELQSFFWLICLCVIIIFLRETLLQTQWWAAKLEMMLMAMIMVILVMIMTAMAMFMAMVIMATVMMMEGSARVRKSKYVFSLIKSVCSETKFPSEWSMTPCKIDTYKTLSCSRKTNLLLFLLLITQGCKNTISGMYGNAYYAKFSLIHGLAIVITRQHTC